MTPAIAFNSSTSLPLLLIQSLNATGALSRLILPNDTAADALERAQSYFLICGTVGTCLTFAVGPRLIEVEPQLQDELIRSSIENGVDGGSIKSFVEQEDLRAISPSIRRRETDTDSERTEVDIEINEQSTLR